jgi:hypothetical protein
MINDPVKLSTPGITRLDGFFFSLRCLEYFFVCMNVNKFFVEIERQHAPEWLQFVLGLCIHGPLGVSCMIALFLGVAGVVALIAGDEIE